MSTKELYTALLTARTDACSQALHQEQVIFEMDEAIRKSIAAEQELNFLNEYNGSDDLLRRRLKLILCEVAVKQYKPIAPADITGSETEQLQKLADAVGCPKITAWLK